MKTSSNRFETPKRNLNIQIINNKLNPMKRLSSQRIHPESIK